ncbi:MAG: hypothetical protein OEQ18_09560 [Gammaproteobacteria bacterium]|nr:hypothetical protein [Gammaproteobacteria bacterium]
MPKFADPKVLFDQDGIRVTTKGMTTPEGEYVFKDIESAGRRIAKPLWGPVLLALLGTLNLAIALETRFWLDLSASAVMLGFGLFWWILGTRYILTLKVADKNVDAWYSRRKEPVSLVLDIVQKQLSKRR